MKTKDPREVYVTAASACLVAAVFAVVFTQGYLAPPRHEVVIQEVWDIDHVQDGNGNQWTNIYTIGQGQYHFRGNHDFQPGHSYRVVFTENMDRWRDLTLIDWVEVTS